MIEMKSWDLGDKIVADYKLPDEVYHICFSYDGGRVGVVINGEELFYTALAGNDCSVSIDKL